MRNPPVAVVPDGGAGGVDPDDVAEAFADVAEVDAAGVAAGADDEDACLGAHFRIVASFLVRLGLRFFFLYSCSFWLAW